MDEAIKFYENTFKNPDNVQSKNIIWENYRRDLWRVVESDSYENIMTLHWTNISGAGGSYDQFIKGSEFTEITFYDGNAGYPNNPSVKYTVRNSDYKIVATGEL